MADESARYLVDISDYIVQASDEDALLVFAGLAPVAVTVPQAVDRFPDGFKFSAMNQGLSVVTFTPDNSTINSGAKLELTKGQSVNFVSDDGHWTAEVSGGLTAQAGATGAAGTQGPAGPQGPKGDAGPTGPQGETGAVGPRGDAGPGPPGADGAVGPKGDTGATGPQGPQGDPGPAGATGPQGAVGPQGLTGAQGPAGGSALVNAGVPASIVAPGTPGQVAWDNVFFYLCINTNQWVRAPLGVWV
jgi:hypothetical protein